MPPPKLTPTEKALKSRIKFLESIFAKIRMQYSFSKGSMTLKDVLLHLHSEGELEYAYENNNFWNKRNDDGESNEGIFESIHSNLLEPITFPQIKALEQHYILNLIQNEKYPYNFQEGQEHEFEGYKYCPHSSKLSEDNGHENKITFNASEGCNTDSSTKHKVEEQAKWHNFFTSPQQIAQLRGKHQRDTAKQIYLNFTLHNRRATLLEGGAGNGKTFVAAAVVRKMLDENFFKDCRSPWPVLWITRASIVEQTSRVCRELFGLCPHTECIVINVEQLRAKFGEYMVDCSTVVRGGEEHIIWTWRPRFHPTMFIIDECQFAKNDDSTQAKIISSISEIADSEIVRVLLMSATPFTRVIEAKYFIVNCHMEISI